MADTLPHMQILPKQKSRRNAFRYMSRTADGLWRDTLQFYHRHLSILSCTMQDHHNAYHNAIETLFIQVQQGVSQRAFHNS